jgi:putative ABC transport system permease protein
VRFLELVRCALEGLSRARLRSALTALGIAIATGALVSMVGFAVGLESAIDGAVGQLGLLNEIEVRPGQPGADGADPAPLDDAALARFEALADVDFAYPDLFLSSALVGGPAGEVEARAIGLPRAAALVGAFESLLAAGRFFAPGDAPEVLVGTALAERLGFATPDAAVGAEVALASEGLARAEPGTELFEMRRERLTATICGVYRPPAAFLPGDAAVVPVDVMRRLPGAASVEAPARRGGFDQVLVRVRAPSAVARVEARLREMGYETESIATSLDGMRDFFLFVDVVFASVGTVALVVAALGILNTLLMIVLERTREIGLYKALGASDGDVRVLFLCEAAVLGLAGGIGGLLLAAGVGRLIEETVARWTAGLAFLGRMPVVFRFPLGLCVGAVLFAVVLSVAGGLYPASRAARVDPIRALRRG